MWSSSTFCTFGLLVVGSFLSTDAFLPAKPSLVTKSTTASKPLTKYALDNVAILSQGYDRHYCTSTVLFMGWGPEPVWSTATISTNDAANQSGDSVAISVSVPPETAQEYTIPGQYVQIRLNEDTKPLFLAIASPPSPENAAFEFLIKKTEGNEWMTSATPGTALQISQVLGGGFPIAENIDGFKYDFPTQNILLFAAGSGIAPLRAAIESGQLGVAQSGSGGRTARLYYGVRTEEDLCFVDKFSQWEASGVQVVPVLSQPGDGWAGRTGYVQNCLEEDGVPIPRNSGALLCGMKGMAESVTDILTKAGVFEGRVLTNF
ncbi:oxidoreductase FAD/NADP-binding domain containing protein [Nitzschia inconspicua]|uniref:Oxidoreductase FAD/NADP-binding domain containing protein n=1 Tax=Nitzschia inconspicua TaxID=303405 RepID=A0A9K3KY21_9STRA|nr:oxidoreductase FAD/NADP-binding domain containing protein [Nitzschia inconspicua]